MIRRVQLVNMTGHDLTVFQDDGPGYVTYQAEGRVRVSSKVEPEEFVELDGADFDVPILGTSQREVSGLGQPRSGVIYVVSGLVASVARRDDVVSPARVVRDGAGGRVRGCRALMRAD
jgi:hypothetical protein